MRTNFEKMTKRNNFKADEEFMAKGRKMNKVRRDRSHKRNWEA